MDFGLDIGMTTEVLLTAGVNHYDFQLTFCWKSTPHDTTEPMKLFLVHTMVFVGSRTNHWFPTQVLLKINIAWDHRPQSQWNSSLSIQWCLLDPYGGVRVVGSCLLCPWGCQWPQKFCWLRGSITDFQPKFCWKSTPHDTTDPMKLFLVHTMLFVGSIWKSKSGWFLFVVPGAVSCHRSFADC
jgi:hypothetical protein